LYGWNYSWPQIKDLYIQKNKEVSERTSTFCTFLVDLVGAIYGSKKEDGEIGQDTGDGLDDLTDEQIAEMKIMLGSEDFNRLYPDLADD